MAPMAMGLRMVRSLRVEASKRTFDPRSIVPSEERVMLPEDLWQNGTVEDLSQWLVKEKGLECPSVRLGVDGFALLPGQSLACLRAEDELMVSPLVPTPMALMPPDAGRPVKAPKPKKPKAIADLPGRAQPAQPAVEPASQPPPSAPAEKPPPSNSPAAKCDVAGLEALVKAQARRIQELEEQNALLQRKVELFREPTSPSTGERSRRWRPIAVEQLKKGNVICYQLDLIDAWKGNMQRSEVKVAVITKVSRTAEGAKSFALRCESGGVDFVEASGLRNVQMACDR